MSDWYRRVTICTMTARTRRKPTIMGSFLLPFPFLVSETVISALQNKKHTVYESNNLGGIYASGAGCNQRSDGRIKPDRSMVNSES